MKQELEIQKFLKRKTDEGLSFEQIKEILLKEPYCISVVEDGELATFRYSQLKSSWEEPICKECRGLILEKDSWRVVRYAFDKFFNFGEQYAADIDWESAVGSEKIDGSLISLYHYKDKWRVATHRTANAYNALLNESVYSGKYKNYGDLWEAAVNAEYPEFFSKKIKELDKDCTYTFELVSPYNKIVIFYDKPKVYHIGTRNNITFKELEVDIGIEKPKEYKLFGKGEFLEYVEYHMDSGHEGIVVRDKNFNRVKLKTKLYVDLAHKAAFFIKGEVSVSKALDIIIRNEQSEFLVYFPEIKPYFDKIEAQWKNVQRLISDVGQEVSEWKVNNSTLTKKDFVEYVNSGIVKKKLIPLYLAYYDNKADYYLSKFEIWKYIEVFDIKI